MTAVYLVAIACVLHEQRRYRTVLVQRNQTSTRNDIGMLRSDTSRLENRY
jgi:hypothetical protein